MKDTSVKKAEAILRHQLHMMWKQPEKAGRIPPLMIWGPPGIGKSTFIRNLCEELDIGFIDIRLAQREPVDIRGLPVPRDDGQGIDWIVSSDWPREDQEGTPAKGIILFDELTAADSTLQVAAYEFILDRRLGQLYKVPDGWYIVAAGNRSSDAAVVRTMSSALANRFCHLELRADSASWIEWALINNIDHRVIGFIRYMPQRIFSMAGNKERGWPSPRSWERVAMELEMANENNLDNDLLNIIVEGLIGEATTIEFMGYLQWSEKIPDVLKMLDGEIKAKVPQRPDQRYAMASAIVHNIRQHEHPETLLNGLFDVLLKFPNDWIQLIHHDLSLSMDNDGKEQFLIEFFDHSRHIELEGKILL